MKKHLLLAFALTASAALAQTNSTAESNPLDVSKFKDIAGGSTLPNPGSVAALKASAESLVGGGKCQEALPVLEKWATEANWIANLTAAGLEPFYSATSSKRNSVASATISVLARYEESANNYKKERNLATVMRAECLVKLNKANEAAAVYARALDLIDSEETVLWSRATKGLYKLIGLAEPAF